MKNNKAFTLVELLAVICIIGLLMGVATTAVISAVNREKRKTYIEDSKKLIALAKETINKDKSISYPNPIDKKYDATIINLGSMKGQEDLDRSPLGPKYNKVSSFVAILPKEKDGKITYEYYATLIACHGDAYKPCRTSSSNFTSPLMTLDDLNKKGSYKKIISTNEYTDIIILEEDNNGVRYTYLNDVLYKKTGLDKFKGNNINYFTKIR